MGRWWWFVVASTNLATAQPGTPQSEKCTGCDVSGALEALLWTPQVFNYTIETVYLVVDPKNHETRTVTTIPNPNTESEWSSISASVHASMAVHGFAGAGVANVTLAVEHIPRFWESKGDDFVTLTYPTSYVYFNTLHIRSYSSVSADGTKSGFCSEIQRDMKFPTPHIYALQVTDSDWTKSQTRTPTVDELNMFPRGAYSTIDMGGDEKSCVPGTNRGVPSTKIPIVGTISTVIQFAEETETGVADGEDGTNDIPETSERQPQNTGALGAGPPVPTDPPPISKPKAGPGDEKPPANAVTVGNDNSTPTLRPIGVPSSFINSPSTPQITPPPALPPSLSILPSSAGILLPNGATLKPGSATVVDGTSLSIPVSATALHVDGTTIPLGPDSNSNIWAQDAGPWLMLPGSTGVLLPNGETLRPWIPTAVGGTLMSLDAERTMVVVGTGVTAATVTLQNIASSTGAGSMTVTAPTLEVPSVMEPSAGSTANDKKSGANGLGGAKGHFNALLMAAPLAIVHMILGGS